MFISNLENSSARGEGEKKKAVIAYVINHKKVMTSDGNQSHIQCGF